MSHTHRSTRRSVISQLCAAPAEEQQARGYVHTLREICQQPELWEITARTMAGALDSIRPVVEEAGEVVLTGSGSSLYVAECIAHAIQVGAGKPVRAMPSGELLLLGPGALPPGRPLLAVSFARSGNSPESAGLIRRLLEDQPEVRHLVVTCNRQGRVAEAWGEGGAQRDPRVQVVTLDDRTCDRSLVMTSSFTSLAVAGLALGCVRRPADYLAGAEQAARLAKPLLADFTDRLAEAAGGGFNRLIVLGDGGSFGAAREAALKMLEMTDGRVVSMAETSLGFRHGPMCALHPNTLLLAFLSSDPVSRAYQVDLLDEIRRKGLGGTKIVVGAPAPREVLADRDVVVDLPGLDSLADDWAALLHVVAGQWLGFVRCRAEGLRPDEPAANGAISRVVGEFPLHGVVAEVES